MSGLTNLIASTANLTIWKRWMGWVLTKTGHSECSWNNLETLDGLGSLTAPTLLDCTENNLETLTGWAV